MKISKLSFITPLKDYKKIILEKEYSQEFHLDDKSSITLASHICTRDTQQDSIAVSENNGYILLLVADGLGGWNNGEVASYTTARMIKKWLENEAKDKLQLLDEKKLRSILRRIIFSISNKIPDHSGTTLNMSIICPELTYIINIGDSRTYTIKDGQITLRSKDDSKAFNRFNPNSSEERDKLRFYRDNYLLTRSITTGTIPKITLTTIKNEEYDLICHITDGISDILTENQIRLYCQEENPAHTLVDKTVSTKPIYNPDSSHEFREYIYPNDNASAVVYRKVRKKNN